MCCSFALRAANPVVRSPTLLSLRISKGSDDPQKLAERHCQQAKACIIAYASNDRWLAGTIMSAFDDMYHVFSRLVEFRCGHHWKERYHLVLFIEQLRMYVVLRCFKYCKRVGSVQQCSGSPWRLLSNGRFSYKRCAETGRFWPLRKTIMWNLLLMKSLNCTLSEAMKGHALKQLLSPLPAAVAVRWRS